MKKTAQISGLVISAIIITIIVVAHLSNKPTVYETKTETQEVTVDALDTLIKDALTASSTEIEAKAQKAYEDAKHQGEVEVKLAVTAKYRAKIEKQEKALQAESIAY